MTVLSALEKSKKKAQALVPMLIEHIRILDQNDGEFPSDIAQPPDFGRYPYVPWPFDFRTCGEFNALRHIDSSAATALEKELERRDQNR